MLNTDPQFLQPFRAAFVIGRITRAVNNSILIHTIQTEAFVWDKRKKKLNTWSTQRYRQKKIYVSEVREYRTLSEFILRCPLWNSVQFRRILLSAIFEPQCRAQKLLILHLKISFRK